MSASEAAKQLLEAIEAEALTGQQSNVIRLLYACEEELQYWSVGDAFRETLVVLARGYL